QALAVEVVLPLAPGVDHGQRDRDAADDADGVLADPLAYAFALFVLVEQLVYSHVLPIMRGAASPSGTRTPERERPASGPPVFMRGALGGPSRPLRRAQWPAGASEPSEDTVKRATFARR